MVSVILPAYNEWKNLQKIVVEIHEVLRDYEHEVVVVDDNSPDGSFEKLNQMNLPYLVTPRRTGPRGFAASILDGIVASKGDTVVVMDSDFNHQPQYLPFMIDNLKYYPCVVGSRFLYGGYMDGRFRHVSSWMFNIFTRVATGGFINDNLYGFVAIRRDILNRCRFEDIFWGYGDYCVRLMYSLQKMNVSILQFPAVNGRRLFGNANSRMVRVFFKYTIAVLKLAWHERFLGKLPKNYGLPTMPQRRVDTN